MFIPSAPTVDYELTWPPGTFREAATSLARSWDGSAAAQDDAVWLLEDAFHGEVPARDLLSATSLQVITARQQINPPATANSRAEAVLVGMASVSAVTGDPRQQYVSYLADLADRLPLHDPAPYWSTRTAHEEVPRRLVQIRWAALVEELQRKGYLARVAPPVCVRDRLNEPGPDYWLDQETAKRLGTDEDLWPLRPGAWPETFFLDLVELVHDLVARPTRRQVVKHRGDNGWCWHFEHFGVQAGQEVYRWQVDRLLARHGASLRFATASEAPGRLVRLAGDDRDELVRRALSSPDLQDRAAVRHAVEQFRGRDASRENKRSAAAALARVLEDRRKLLKTELLSKDEGALFQIANQFDVRHRAADQRPDYDEAYLDWIFWWYLGTVELTDRLLARQNTPDPR